MKATIESVHIKNFKAFQDAQSFEFDNKNVLAFGNNGSGKSSLFWALYTFLQSSIKEDASTQKYFRVFDPLDKDTHQSLRNVFINDAEDSYIEVVIKEDNGNKKTYKIEEGNIPTNPDNNGGDFNIQLLNLASDFINYKLLHNFYRGSHKVEVNIWQVFERDIFPFLTDDANRNWMDRIRTQTRRTEGRRGSQNRQAFEDRLNQLNTEIESLLAQIERNANNFIKDYFFEKKEVILVKITFDKKFTFDRVKSKLWDDGREAHRQSELFIKLAVRIKEGENWTDISRPHSFLNEAQLTRIAIGIRIGALRTRVQTTQFKILVLDDMLISLDMSNRMKVIKMILGQQEGLTFFDDFQKIILTHDRGFYELIKRHTTIEHWKYFNFDKDESNNNPPTVREDYDWLAKAQNYLRDGKIDECGLALRKATENMVAKSLKGLSEAANRGKYKPLAGELTKLNDSLRSESLDGFRNLIDTNLTEAELWLLKTDFEGNDAISETDKVKLRTQRDKLVEFVVGESKVRKDQELLFTQLQDLLKRVMNPSAHASLTSLYPGELQEAIDAVMELKAFLER